MRLAVQLSTSVISTKFQLCSFGNIADVDAKATSQGCNDVILCRSEKMRYAQVTEFSGRMVYRSGFVRDPGWA